MEPGAATLLAAIPAAHRGAYQVRFDDGVESQIVGVGCTETEAREMALRLNRKAGVVSWFSEAAPGRPFEEIVVLRRIGGERVVIINGEVAGLAVVHYGTEAERFLASELKLHESAWRRIGDRVFAGRTMGEIEFVEVAS